MEETLEFTRRGCSGPTWGVQVPHPKEETDGPQLRDKEEPATRRGGKEAPPHGGTASVSRHRSHSHGDEAHILIFPIFLSMTRTEKRPIKSITENSFAQHTQICKSQKAWMAPVLTLLVSTPRQAPSRAHNPLPA